MYFLQTIVNKDVAIGLSGHRDNKWYTPEKINEDEYLHTSHVKFNTYEDAFEYVNTRYKHSSKVNIVSF